MKNEINDKVEKTLAAFDNMERAEVKPFFYTRLQGRLQSDDKSMAIQRKFVWATVVVILILNSLFYAFYEPAEDINTDDVIVQMYDEYNIEQIDLLEDVGE
ncbi:hypothetical protein [Fulvivirga lutimaris]|uniref:hypothetical protein n=1 Tax=Fulvivirga lutimaris TaxID=1819566 RepID=UPI0012BD2294|nr:hypothetical protein [Fulvivirga lutimaris]MTI40071.1 hypothetical protein [Fulvivirga lutimaris]